jgi:hypothetical protein
MNPTIEKCRGNSKDDSKEKSQEDSWIAGLEYKPDRRRRAQW